MKIAIYHPWIYLHGGIERSLLELVNRSEHDWTIFTNHYDPKNTFAGFERHKVIELKRVTVQRDISSVMKVSWQLLGQKLKLEGFDALVIICDGLGNLMTLRNKNGLPTFCLCCTPLRAAYDPVYEAKVRETKGIGGKIAYTLFKKGFQFVDRMAWRKYDGVIAISSEVKSRITLNRLYPNNERFKIYYPGVDTRTVSSETTYEPMLLLPGRIMWTKNIEMVVEAFLKAALPTPWKLVVTGFVDAKSQPYLARLRDLAKGSNAVEFVVCPSDDELDAMYRRASVVLFPPLNEDWGIIPLEANARAKPVIANNRGGPAESIIHGKTGWLIEPTSEAWITLMRSLPAQNGTIKSMGEAARIHARKFDWTEFVSGIDNTLVSWTGKASTGHKK